MKKFYWWLQNQRSVFFDTAPFSWKLRYAFYGNGWNCEEWVWLGVAVRHWR